MKKGDYNHNNPIKRFRVIRDNLNEYGMLKHKVYFCIGLTIGIILLPAIIIVSIYDNWKNRDLYYDE